MSRNEEKVWRAADLRWRSWDGEWIVYNLASGNTHLLTPVAASALKILEQKPANVIDLSRELAACAKLTPDNELMDHVSKLLANLDELGLIESIA